MDDVEVFALTQMFYRPHDLTDFGELMPREVILCVNGLARHDIRVGNVQDADALMKEMIPLALRARRDLMVRKQRGARTVTVAFEALLRVYEKDPDYLGYVTKIRNLDLNNIHDRKKYDARPPIPTKLITHGTLAEDYKSLRGYMTTICNSVDRIGAAAAERGQNAQQYGRDRVKSTYEASTGALAVAFDSYVWMLGAYDLDHVREPAKALLIEWCTMGL